MSKQRRWLWPCSDSHILRHQHYQHVVYESCPAAEDDILWPGSDDDLDDDQHRSKKRRIETLATSYLSGNGLFVASAALRGPFQKNLRATKDKYANYIVGEPLLPGPASKHNLPKKAPAKPSTNPTRKNTQKEGPAKHSKPYRKEGDAKDRQSKRREDRAVNVVQGALPAPVRQSSFFHDRHHIPNRRTPDPQSDHSHTPTPSPHTATPSRPPQSSPSRLLSSLSKPSSVVPPPAHNDSIMLDTCFSAHQPLDDDNGTESSTVASIAWNVAPPSAFTPINHPAVNHSSHRQPPTNLHLDGTTLAETHFPQPARYPMAHEFEIPTSGMGAKTNKGHALKKKRNNYIEAVPTNDASPLLFRRKNEAAPRTTTSEAIKDATAGASEPKTKKSNPRPMIFNSSIDASSQPTDPSKPRDHPVLSMNAPTAQPAPSPKPLTDDFAPAINMSFDQGSLAVNFDFIDRHTNSFLPASTNSPRKQVVSQQLRRAMRESGASFTISPATNHLPPVESPSSSTKSQRPSAVKSLYRLLVLDGTVSDPTELEKIHAERTETEKAEVERQETDNNEAEEKDVERVINERIEAERIEAERVEVERTEVEGIEAERTDLVEEDDEDTPYISTQAAMQDAHRGLFDSSSPEITRTEQRTTEQATPALQQDRHSIHDITITPFHEFHAKMAAEAAGDVQSDMQSPLPNTQALFDNMTPFLSPEKPKNVPLPKQKTKKRASFAPILEGRNDMSVLLSPENIYSPADAQSNQNSDYSSISAQSQQETCSKQASEPFSARHTDGIEGCQDQQEDESPKQGNTHFVPSVARSRSSSPDIIWSQRSGPSASQRAQSLMPQEQSVRLSDVLQELRSSRGSQIHVDDTLSTDPSRTSQQKGRSSGLSKRRSSAKSRPSAKSDRRSSGRNQPQESSSQPGNVSKRSLRSRMSLSQADPSSLHFVSTPAEQRLTGSTTIADETVSSMQPPVITEDVQSSNLTRNSLLGQTPSGQVNSIASVPTTSARSKKLFGSHQAAQRVQDLDLDSTLDDVMKSVGSWDVERETGRALTASVG